MSTDDSISEDVSSSALSHCHASADGDGEKESETSLVSSEGTSASGLAVSEERHTTSQTTPGTVESRPMDITPACNKIRSLCLSTDEAFEQGKSLPFINPSSLETLRALVQEIQSSGETDPEVWKDCEGRWLHLFQLVEKQYQEQILAQQEQYQCQIQLIQDEIKALVQLQNRQTSVHQQTEFSPTLVPKSTTNTKDYIFPVIPSDCTVLINQPNDNSSLAASVHSAFSSPSPPLPRSETHNQGEEQTVTMLSSGYGTLCTWKTGLEPDESPEDLEPDQGVQRHQWDRNLQKETETTVIGHQLDYQNETTVGGKETKPVVYQHTAAGSNQQLTSWAQRQKLRPKKSKAEQASPQISTYPDQSRSPREPNEQTPLGTTDFRSQHRPDGLLRRSDSLTSEASGLTYWRLNECELYWPLPDSFDSNTYLLLQETSMNPSPSQEPRLSLKELYHKQKDCKRIDSEGSVASSPLSPQQVLTLDATAHTQHSDRTSGFTSPSHFSSPSFPAQHYTRAITSITPDSMVEGSPNPGDTDCISDTSSASAAGPSPTKMQSTWGNISQAELSTSRVRNQSSHMGNQQHRASAPLGSEEECTHTSTLKPRSALGAALRPAASPHTGRASSLEDPVVLSLLRQNLREKHARHVADLKAYYEAEIQNLQDKLKLKDLPQDLEKSNLMLTQRCKHLQKALADATSRIQELEATNSSLEKKLAEWPERYAVAGATVKSLQQRLEESSRSGKERDALNVHLKTRVRQLEETAQKACREADEKEAKRERENKMLQDLLREYDSLMKEHEVVKNNLVSAEGKLVDANSHISELKRVISKLESQVKQLEHENQARLRSASHSNTQPSGAGLFHHPDLLSPSKNKTEPDFTWRKSPRSMSDQLNGSRRSTFSKTNQSSVHKRSASSVTDQSSGTGSSVDFSSAGSWRCASPPECEQTLLQARHQELSAPHKEAGRREGSSPLTPMMRALIELEETKATESRAPWLSHQRTTVGFVERKHKEAIQQRTELNQAEEEARTPGGIVAGAEQGGAQSRVRAERAAALLRGQRSLSPEGHRSSSLPPAQRNVPTATPTKRETLLGPLSAKSSPKRCPSDNFSTAFGHLMPREEYLLHVHDGPVDKRRHSFHSSSPRKRLQFTSADSNELQESESSRRVKPLDPQLGWEEHRDQGLPDLQNFSEDSAPLVLDRPQSLAEAERLLDELTQEKLQIEAALSRMPGAGGRVSLQTRLDEGALEKRLERLNRDLGSIRMTLKRFHVLRSSANI